jgi:hypothetical protein
LALCRLLPSFLHVAPLEKGQQCPRKVYSHQLGAHPGRRRDVRQAERVSTVTSGPARPSPALCRHPRHCRAIPNTVGACIDGTPPRRPLCSSSPPPTTRPSNRRTDDDQTRAPVGPPSKPPLNKHSNQHDTRKGQDLPGQPSNHKNCTPVTKPMRHACEPPPPLGL